MYVLQTHRYVILVFHMIALRSGTCFNFSHVTECCFDTAVNGSLSLIISVTRFTLPYIVKSIIA